MELGGPTLSTDDRQELVDQIARYREALKVMYAPARYALLGLIADLESTLATMDRSAPASTSSAPATPRPTGH
jgi:hypothetical protein